MPSPTPLYGAIEAGGTKFVCAIGRGPEDLEEIRFATRGPTETLAEAAEFFRAQTATHGPLAALGIGSFGPADVKPTSPDFGTILNTPKPGWAGTDVLAPLRSAVGEIPMAFDTDVNAAALGERQWGAARGFDDIIYLTVGTGIGGGVICDGRLLHGSGHPEIGHLRVPHDLTADPFKGSCPFHGDCLEGLASGTALGERWGIDPRTLPPDHQAWQLQSAYLADALANLFVTFTSQRFILGGGVMEQGFLHSMVAERLQQRIADYLPHPAPEDWVVAPELGARAGVLGALALAKDVVEPA